MDNFNDWKDMIEMGGKRKIDFSKITKRKKSLRLTDTQYNIVMRTLSELVGEKEEHNIERMDDRERTKVLNFIQKCIKHLELYRITWLNTSPFLGVRDLDGVSHNIVKYKMKQLSEINWNDDEIDGNGISSVTIEQINDDDKTHSSQSVDTIGELYRTVEHQLLHYEINYLNPSNDGKEMM
jgi:hypothetical protein